MKKKRPAKTARPTSLKQPPYDRLNEAVFWVPAGLLFIVPLAFSTSVRTIYSLPKFTILLVGTSVLLLLWARRLVAPVGDRLLMAALLNSGLVRLVGLYFACIALSTVFGVASLVSLFGSSSNFMGLLTQLCFFIGFLGLIIGIGTSDVRLRRALWVMVASGGLVALYAAAQFFGLEPFVPTSIYTFTSPAGPVARVCSSLGHSNYLGNLLLYVAPLAAALAFASGGRARWLRGLAALLTLAAIVLSGARGAWAGILAGAAVFAALERKEAAARFGANRRRALQAAAVILATVSLAAILIALSPAARSIGERVEALRREGVESSGRLILWRDSLKMVPAYAPVGCGPEGFRKAFLAYKSPELAQLAPTASNESPHNAYLEAAIAYGLPAAALYIAIIVLTLMMMARTRRHAPSAQWRITMTGLIAAFVAVLVHHLFIFNQISTGLYFFAFVGLAVASANCFGASPAAAVQPAAGSDHSATAATVSASPARSIKGYAFTAVAALAVVMALWYAVGLITAERAYKKLFEPATANNLQALTQEAERATASPLPTRAYDLMAAYAFETYARRLATQINARTTPPTEASSLTQTRASALQLALSYAERSLKYTNTPDANYTTLASIAMASGNTERLYSAATEAVRRDPTNYQARWLLAEAYLARGDRESAKREAEASLDLYYGASEAASVLARARGEQPTDDVITKILIESRNQHGAGRRSPEELITVARKLAETGKLKRARLKLLTAVSRTDGPCPDCHRELAIVYEKMSRFAAAITEWQTYMAEAPERAAAEQVAARIETLKQKSNATS